MTENSSLDMPSFGLEGAIATPAAAEADSAVPADDFTAADEAELTRLQAKAERSRSGGAEAVRMKVEPPHESMTHAGLTIGSDFTSVPSHLAPVMSEAAAVAGVTLTQEE
jgi:hypothetical protein